MSDATPKPARPAATIVLVREQAEGLEVYLTRRNPALRFLGGFHVFPGGSVDTEDAGGPMTARMRGLDSSAAGSHLGMAPHTALAHWAAACRELFEEVGVLLACDAAGRCVDRDLASALRAERARLQHGEVTFADVLARHDLFLTAGDVGYFAHWVTPEYVATRFDTRFFVARLPEGQATDPWEAEVDEAVWLTPGEALARWERQELRMIPPTVHSLQLLEPHRTFEAARAGMGRTAETEPA